MRRLEDISAAIAAAGLVPRGAVTLTTDERVEGLQNVRTLALVGFAASRGWDAFAASPEKADGQAHPLDRWSRRVVGALARDLGAVPLFPFDGPPYRPFQRWAQRAEPVFASPLGLAIHAEYGLWHSYHGALGFAESIDTREGRVERVSPCETCAARPCLTACPVSAFTPAGYDVEACAAHLRSPAGGECMTRGCLARRACPVAPAYSPDQASFHMRAFLAARG